MSCMEHDWMTSASGLTRLQFGGCEISFLKIALFLLVSAAFLRLILWFVQHANKGSLGKDLGVKRDEAVAHARAAAARAAHGWGVAWGRRPARMGGPRPLTAAEVRDVAAASWESACSRGEARRAAAGAGAARLWLAFWGRRPKLLGGGDPLTAREVRGAASAVVLAVPRALAFGGRRAGGAAARRWQKRPNWLRRRADKRYAGGCC